MSLHILEHHSLLPYNTFGIDVKARYFVSVHTLDDLRDALRHFSQTPTLILGGGSNVLFTQDFEGLVLHICLKGIDLLETGENGRVWVSAAAGEPWHPFVQHCLAQGWAGLENLSLIPGTVGAAPLQNIGAYGMELKDAVYQVKALNRQSLEIEVFEVKDCAFAYRESVFKRQLKDQYVITEVVFELTTGIPTLRLGYGDIQATLEAMGCQDPSPLEVSEAVCRIRRSKLPDPAEIGNAGSFFKNPIIQTTQFLKISQQYPQMPSYLLNPMEVKVPAGWLIEQAGWKGKRLGAIGVHPKQALVLVNYGGAAGREIAALSADIQADVMQKFGIQLQPEINIIG
ncbi:UDP-N-acetylmuramate dehydrogenase [Eisenibacter elegans]|jgi:UDP-N-acetylmuramate dehydrogenase|uniref:UDP-N-acetylmuramate dehydrogenase n=1 Tax=Eisenibacter elegans TaxID=997 RepID=UPI0003FAFDF7|nr:UDP-N-acetylmuramate dehydrogenase [Eisenibacter elegans]